MLQILYYCHVSPDFLDVLLKFGDQPQVFQESSLCNSLSKSSDGDYSENTLSEGRYDCSER